MHHEDVSFIMENKSCLSEGIFVNREFSPEIERKRRTMLPILREAKHIDKHKKQIRLEKDKIVIKGKDYDMSNIHDMPDDLNAFKVTSKEDGRVIGYFGELNPLSNFFPAKFKMDGLNFISSEQYIQASKAGFFGDTETYNQIMGCKHSVNCKNLSKKIKGVDNAKWELAAADLCRPGIRQKFVQNPILLEVLVKCTGTKQIVECSKDRLWGTGIPLIQDDCLDCDRWISSGIMGKMLEDIRMEFNNQFNSDQHSLNGVQRNLPDAFGSTPCQAAQSHLSTGPTTHPTLSSSLAQPDHALQTANDLPLTSSSNHAYDNPNGLRPNIFQQLTTPSEVQPQSQLYAENIVTGHPLTTPMDHSEPADIHSSGATSAELSYPPGN